MRSNRFGSPTAAVRAANWFAGSAMVTSRDTDWPVGLRGDECEAGTKSMKNPPRGRSGEKTPIEDFRAECVAALNDLLEALEKAYPKEDARRLPPVP